MPTLLKVFFWWLQWLKHPKEGGYFGMRDKPEANGSSKVVTPSVYKLKVIHPGFYFNSKATKPAEIHLRWMPWNKRISSGQRSGDRMPTPRGRHQDWRLVLPTVRLPGTKERTGNCCCSGREETKTGTKHSGPLHFHHFSVCSVKFFHRLKNWKQHGALFSPASPNPTTFIIWLGRREAISVGNGYLKTI